MSYVIFLKSTGAYRLKQAFQCGGVQHEGVKHLLRLLPYVEQDCVVEEDQTGSSETRFDWGAHTRTQAHNLATFHSALYQKAMCQIAVSAAFLVTAPGGRPAHEYAGETLRSPCDGTQTKEKQRQPKLAHFLDLDIE